METTLNIYAHAAREKDNMPEVFSNLADRVKNPYEWGG